jgi:hypothetical protein
MKGEVGDFRKNAAVMINPQPGCVCQHSRQVVSVGPDVGKLCST